MNEIGPLQTSLLPVRFTSRELIDRAQIQSESAPVHLKHSVYCYYIARFATSYYEVNASEIGEIPIQVWNEYRNALDHFMRHVTMNPGFAFDNNDGVVPKGNHLSKMDGHIQRAALDSLKLIVHLELDECREDIANFRLSVLRLGDGGKFHKNYEKYRKTAEKSFQDAKVLDSELGEHPGENKDVLTRYIDAASAVSDLKVYFDTHSAHLESLEYGLLNNLRMGKILSNLNSVGLALLTGLMLWFITLFIPHETVKNSVIHFFSGDNTSNSTSSLPPLN